jgi:hypothetical protein
VASTSPSTTPTVADPGDALEGGSAHLALGAVRGGQVGGAGRKPRLRLLQAVKSRHDGKLAAIAVARKLARRCYQTLRAIDPELVYAVPEL